MRFSIVSNYRYFFFDEYQRVLENDLNGWYTDESLWPENRTWEIFHQWFNIKIDSIFLNFRSTFSAHILMKGRMKRLNI